MSGLLTSASGSDTRLSYVTLSPLPFPRAFSSPSAKWEEIGLHCLLWGGRECQRRGGDRKGCTQGTGVGGPAIPGKGVSEMEEAVSLGLCPPQSPARRGERKQAHRGWRPSPNLVIRTLCVVFLLQKTLIYCNLKNDRARDGDSAAGAREREISFCSAGNWAAASTPHPAPLPAIVLPECRMSTGSSQKRSAFLGGLNRPAFIKSLETSEGKRCVGRYVRQPGWGWGFDDSPQPLGSPCGLQPRARAGKGGLEGGGRLAGSSVGGSSPLPRSCQALSHLPGCPPHLYCSVRQKMIMGKQPAPSRQAQQINKSPNLLPPGSGGAPLGPEPWSSFGTHHWRGAPSAVPLRDRSTSPGPQVSIP